ncbi:MAG: thermonuclease family protein [Actinomycetota bacterium]|nr:thermonuclease family protein [Actinomycetota bacterium]
MSDRLILLRPAGALVAVRGLVRGRVIWPRLATRRVVASALAASFVTVMAGCVLPAPDALPSSTPPPSPAPEPAQPAPPHGVPAGAQAGVVERIVDGDTLWVRIDQPRGPLAAAATHQIRVLEIDSPETKHPQRGVECWGPEATAFANHTLPVGSAVYLVADKEDRDRFGRFLRYLWNDRGAFYNEVAVRQGFARAVLYEPNDAYIDLMRAAEEEARAANRGMWGPPCNSDGSPASASASARALAPALSKPAPPPRRVPQSPAPPEGCDPNYGGACVPPHPPDLDCDDVAEKDFQSVGSDPHGLDGDKDGVACES